MCVVAGWALLCARLHPCESGAQGLMLWLRHGRLSLCARRLVQGAVVEEDGHARRERLPCVRALGDLKRKATHRGSERGDGGGRG
jgi:hypothetical protein